MSLGMKKINAQVIRTGFAPKNHGRYLLVVIGKGIKTVESFEAIKCHNQPFKNIQAHDWKRFAGPPGQN